MDRDVAKDSSQQEQYLIEAGSRTLEASGDALRKTALASASGLEGGGGLEGWVVSLKLEA